MARAAALDPFMATCAAIGGHDDELPDLSVDGFAERAGLDRSTQAAPDAAEAPALREQIAQAAMRELVAASPSKSALSGAGQSPTWTCAAQSVGVFG